VGQAARPRAWRRDCRRTAEASQCECADAIAIICVVVTRPKLVAFRTGVGAATVTWVGSEPATPGSAYVERGVPDDISEPPRRILERLAILDLFEFDRISAAF